MVNDFERLFTLVYTNLALQCPILSGNMKSSIKTTKLEYGEVEIVVEAKFYDLEEFEKTGAVVFTGEIKDGATDYALAVNKFGGFFSRNESTGWVNRAIFEAVNTIANEIGAEVVNELEL